MPFERFRPIYHERPPIAATEIYAVPSGYQAMVKPVRLFNTSGASNSIINLYQGSGLPERTVLSIDVDPEGMVQDDAAIYVASGYPLFADQSLASGVTMHLQAIESPDGP